jgi:hypothetical protein
MAVSRERDAMRRVQARWNTYVQNSTAVHKFDPPHPDIGNAGLDRGGEHVLIPPFLSVAVFDFNTRQGSSYSVFLSNAVQEIAAVGIGERCDIFQKLTSLVVAPSWKLGLKLKREAFFGSNSQQTIEVFGGDALECVLQHASCFAAPACSSKPFAQAQILHPLGHQRLAGCLCALKHRREGQADMRMAIDLAAAAAALPEHHKALAKKILRSRDAHSAHTDITCALDMAQSVRPAHDAAEGGLQWAAHAVLSLTISAVVLYTRATKTRSDHRGTLNLDGKFDPAQRMMHERIVALRDDCVAHYGPGDAGGGLRLNEERILVPLDRVSDSRVMMASKRLAFVPRFTMELEQHLCRVAILVQAEVERRDNTLADALNAAGAEDPFLPALFQDHLVDLDEMFAEHPAARCLDGSRYGLHTSVVWGPMKL